MSRTYIPPFPTSNASDDTQYTQFFENARTKKRPGNPPEPVLANPTTPSNPRHREPEPPRVTASPLHPSYFPAGKSPLHHQGNNGGRGSHSNIRPPDPPRVTASPLHQSYIPAGKSPLHHQGNNGGRGTHGNSRPGYSYKPVDPGYPSPKPSKNSGSGISHEGLIGNSTPARNTPSRYKKKPAEPVQYDDLVPPFPSDGTDANYTEVFARIRKGNMSPTAPPAVPYTPRHDQSTTLKSCSCVIL